MTRQCEVCGAPATSGVHTTNGWRYWCSRHAGRDPDPDRPTSDREAS